MTSLLATPLLLQGGGTAAVEVSREVELKRSPDEIWGVIGGFGQLADWHPAVETCELDQRHGSTFRELALVGGGLITEELTGHDDAARRYAYNIIESPLPVENYRSAIEVRPSGSGSRVVWSSSFDPKGASEAEAATVIEGVYEAGLQALVQRFG